MKVICDNCGAMYKIPDEKLVKPVNKATCRQCSHRMLIPRPRRGADPDERTLVTAVPPTPSVAPLRAADSGPPTTPIHEVEELTAPTGGKMKDETKWVRNDVAAASAAPAAPTRGTAQVSVRPAGGAATERVPAHTGPPTPPAPVMPQLSSQAPASPPRTHTRDSLRRAAALADDVATQVGPDPTLTIPPRDEPTPAPTPTPAPAAPTHDPRGDMGLALFGVAVAILGVTILGISSVLDLTSNYWLVLGASALGMLFAVGGSVGAFLVLMTSGRGRKPAWRAASVIVAMLVAIVVAALPALGRVGYDTFATGFDGLDDLMAAATPGDLGTEIEEPPSLGDLAMTEPDAPDAAAEAGATDSDAGGAVEDTDGTAEPDPDPVDEPADPPAAASGTSRSPASTSRTSRTSPGRTSSGTSSDRTSTRPPATGRTTAPALTDEQELDLPDDPLSGGSTPTKPPSSALPASPPLKAIDVMVKSNVSVKKCFFDYQRAEGALPKRVDVRFTIKPSGDATRIGTTQNKLKGTDLESCLIRAIRSINFPPSQDGTTLTFPFVFG